MKGLSLPEHVFRVRRPVNFWETDAMGVVHHSNYPKYFEEARTGWLRRHELLVLHYPATDMTLAVIEYAVRHLAPLRFGQEITVFMQLRSLGVRIECAYAVQNDLGTWVATGRTVHVPLNSELRPRKLPQVFRDQLERELWIETWP